MPGDNENHIDNNAGLEISQPIEEVKAAESIIHHDVTAPPVDAADDTALEVLLDAMDKERRGNISEALNRYRLAFKVRIFLPNVH